MEAALLSFLYRMGCCGRTAGEGGPVDFEALREQMVAVQIRARGVTAARVLAAMRKVPRHLFVPEAYRDQAYEDHPAPIGEGQTISQPYIVAEMTQALGLAETDRVLEIGTGSGYQTAILAELCSKVYTVERLPGLHAAAVRILAGLGYENVAARCGDGTLGWPEEAPFDAVLVTAGAPVTPPALLAQLALGGRMVIPVGDQHIQSLTRLVRTERGVRSYDLGGCRFVPLLGEQGWKA